MGIMISNPNSYNISLEGEVSDILSHFNSDFVFDIIKDNINNRFNYFQLAMVNIPASFEARFKTAKLQFPENVDQIEEIRIDTYNQILNILANNFNVQINYNNITDVYSAAYYLYDFLVSNFSNNLVSFFANYIVKEKNSLYEGFANYIVKEKNSLYEGLQLARFKKSKDSSTIYAKKLYKNPKLAIINANLDYVIDNICAFDISFYTILNTIYQDKNIIKYLSDICLPIYDFFKTTYASLLQSQYRPILLTNIRLEIQRLSINEDIDITNIK